MVEVDQTGCRGLRLVSDGACHGEDLLVPGILSSSMSPLLFLPLDNAVSIRQKKMQTCWQSGTRGRKDGRLDKCEAHGMENQARGKRELQRRCIIDTWMVTSMFACTVSFINLGSSLFRTLLDLRAVGAHPCCMRRWRR